MRARALSLAVAAGLVLGGCRSGTEPTQGPATTMAHMHAVAPTESTDGLPAPVTGPQGRVPQFAVSCGWSHRAQNDPIVHPGKPGRSHLHDFFGNTSTDAYSGLASLRAGDTTCVQKLDTAAYWAPALFDGGQPVTPRRAVAYYRPAVRVDPASLVAYPPGLKMLAGDPTATSPQAPEIVSWSCGTGTERRPTPHSCPGAELRLWVTFPDCWDGAHVDSPDHRAHMTSSRTGACPASHPVAVPQLVLAIDYPAVGDDLELASGGTFSGHADFLNAWDQQKLETDVKLCLGRGLVCALAGYA